MCRTGHGGNIADGTVCFYVEGDRAVFVLSARAIWTGGCCGSAFVFTTLVFSLTDPQEPWGLSSPGRVVYNMGRSVPLVRLGLAARLLAGCGAPPTLDGPAGCDVSNRTPLVDANDWTGPELQEVSDELSAQPPAFVVWDERTLDVTNSPVSAPLRWNPDEAAIVESDCPDSVRYLSIPVALDLDVGEGGVVGTLEGELRVDPDEALWIRAEGEVEPFEPWASAGLQHVADEQVAVEVASWRATVRGSWSGAAVRLDAVSLDAAGRDQVTVLWDVHWTNADADE